MVTREGGEENRCYKEDRAFRRLQGELSVYAENFSDSFLRLARANPLGQNATRITISMSWSAAPGRVGEEGGRRLDCGPDTISWAH